MKFEKEFPSLKGFEHSEDINGHNLFSEYQIEKHCLDKQRVRETIKRLRIGIKYARDNPINESTEIAAQTQLDLIGIFEEALGLE